MVSWVIISSILCSADILTWRVGTGAIFSPILESYKRKIMNYASGMRPPDRQMLELESYSIHASGEYVNKLGLDTTYMKRVTAKDWIIDIPFLEAPGEDMLSVRSDSSRLSLPRKSGLVMSSARFRAVLEEFTENEIYKEKVDELITECEPKVDAEGKLVKPATLLSTTPWSWRWV